MQEGHDIYHVLRVLHFGRIIYRAEWGDEQGAQLTGLACACHNADRILEKRLSTKDVPRNEIEKLVYYWLEPTNLNHLEVETILNSVLLHNGKNSEEHTNITKALRDADRVVNLELDVIIRSAQLHSNIPPVDYNCFYKQPPNYRNPETVIEDLALCLEWVELGNPFSMQTPTGWRLAEENAEDLQWFFEKLKRQLKKSGFLTQMI